ncbi:MAG: chemotaxis protein CheA [Gammaproteobacteria bacterium]|nr:chemotaxis protein CheA [Gammaproteobacteria bacterium]
MAIDMEQFHQVFFEESFEGLDVMETGLLNLDNGEADDEEINTIFRAAHSIKGGSGTFGFQNIADFTHIMETLLDEVRDGIRELNHAGINVLLKSVDCLRMMMNAASEGSDVDDDEVKVNFDALQNILGSESGPSTAASTAVVASDTPAAVSAGAGWKISFAPHKNFMQFGNDPVRVIRELATLGALNGRVDTSKVPDFASLNPEDMYLSWEMELAGNVNKAAIDDVFAWVEDESDISVSEAKNTAAEAPNSADAPQEAASQTAVAKKSPAASTEKKEKAAAASSSIRVGIDKIDDLINMVGELVITQSMLSMLGEDFNMSRLEKLQEGLIQLSRHTRELQESVMQIRMVPISFTFSRFPRMVRDLSEKLGKRMELVMHGENTELDKTVIEKIGDPLVHLVRNSIDHGIEMPADRIAAGKPEMGTIQLNAFHRGGNIVIEITDDGKGIDKEVIFNKGVEKGLVEPGAKLSDQQIYDLLFNPGFSTATEITDVSGRGVGMDVVKKNIMSLGGAIETHSVKGQGSIFSIRLPLTLAILDGQSVSVGSDNYIIPLVSIVESVQPKKESLNMVAGKGETYKLRDEYLPIIRVGDLFQIPDAKAQKLEDGLLVVVEADGKRFGVFVDDLLGQQQVVIKSLESNYKRIDGISGATILGDGSVALILDILGLVRMTSKQV